MSQIRELYQEVILDHGKSPRNFGKLDSANHESHGHDPLCGDTVTVYLDINKGIIKEIGFEGRGCAISIASASLMTEVLKGKNLQAVSSLFDCFHDLVTSDEGSLGDVFDNSDLERLFVLSGVREFPMRVKCATLAWHTMQAAIKDNEEKVSTE